ncbi:MAG: acetate/propionate family kinase [Actinomycetota bacterium]
MNVGSTSLKYAVFGEEDDVVCRGKAGRVTSDDAELAHGQEGATARTPLPRPGLEAALEVMVEALRPTLPTIEAAAFKVVHGGDQVTGTVILDEAALAALERFAPAAPAHNPPYVMAVRHVARILPGVPLIGSFETAFHADWSAEARAYAIPAGWERAHGLRRYGFHGASHRYVSERMAELEPAAPRVLSCHLGGSSSICAIVDGRSVDATMGFSPQSGLPQAERVGDLDAFALVHLAREGIGLEEAAEALATKGGLLGLSGLSGDLQELEAAEESGHEGAAFALRVYAYEVRKAVGALAAAMGGLDAVAFTGGMGENSVRLRERVCDGLGFLGIELDPARNHSAAGEARASQDGAAVAVWVIPTDEERILVRQARELLSARG